MLYLTRNQYKSHGKEKRWKNNPFYPLLAYYNRMYTEADEVLVLINTVAAPKLCMAGPPWCDV